MKREKENKISCSFVCCCSSSSNSGSASFRCRWTELDFKLPSLCVSYELQLIWMCMTNMLTFTKIRTKIYGENNNNNNKSHYGWASTWAHRKEKRRRRRWRYRKRRTIAQMVHFRSFNYITLLVRLSSAFVCCTDWLNEWIVWVNVSCFDLFVIRIAFLWIVYCICYGRVATFEWVRVRACVCV